MAKVYLFLCFILSGAPNVSLAAMPSDLYCCAALSIEIDPNIFLEQNQVSDIYGCTDTLAINYNPEATIDDGSCIIPGCMDELADNYNPIANEEDGSCIYQGCTDELATNYDSQANEDDGSCLYLHAAMNVSVISGCAPLTFTVFNQTLIQEDAICLFELNDEIIETDCLPNFQHILIESGTYNLKYTYEHNGSITDSTIAIVVHPLPSTPIITYDSDNFDIVCSNCESSSIQWVYESSVVNDSVNNSMSVWFNDSYRNGFYRVTITENENGCISSSEDLFVLQPYFSVDNIEGCNPLNIEASNLTYDVAEVQYSLDFGDGTINDSFETTANYIYQVANTYTITINATSPHGSGSYAQTVQVFPTIEPILVHVPNDGLVVCENCSLFQSVIWNMDGIIFNDFGPHSDYAEIYTVTGTTSHGCVDSTVFSIGNVAVSFLDENQISLYPNPANEFVVVEQKQNSPYSLQVFDFTGKMIYNNHLNQSKFIMNTGSWDAGIYMIKLSNNGTVSSFKLVVNH